MSKSQRFMMLITLAVALILTVIFAGNYLSARKHYSDLLQNLERSTANWNRINAEKEILQGELKSLKEELRDAELTVQESGQRIIELREDIALLENEIQDLLLMLPSRGNS